jgi:exosortase/archaeosortase family protein
MKMTPAGIRAWRFTAVAVPTMMLLYAVLYAEHTPTSFAGGALGGYLDSLARLSAFFIGLFDRSVTVRGNQLGGRFALTIVLDCGALDLQAVLAAAVLAFPVPWRRRAIGLALGTGTLAALNVLRIVALYFVGVLAPGWFHAMHEEVFALVMVIGAGMVFAAWAFWALERGAVPPLALKELLGATD